MKTITAILLLCCRCVWADGVSFTMFITNNVSSVAGDKIGSDMGIVNALGERVGTFTYPNVGESLSFDVSASQDQLNNGPFSLYADYYGTSFGSFVIDNSWSNNGVMDFVDDNSSIVVDIAQPVTIPEPNIVSFGLLGFTFGLVVFIFGGKLNLAKKASDF